MSIYVATYQTSSLGVNRTSYLDSSDSNLFIKTSDLSESFFGSSHKDTFLISAFDASNNLIVYAEETPNKQYFKFEYTYEDVDGNTFRYSVDKQIPYIVCDPNRNSLFDVNNFILSNSISSDFNLLVNPVTRIFSFENQLIVKEIGSSRQEVKLVPNFSYVHIDEILYCSTTGSSMSVNNSSSISIENGRYYIIQPDTSIENLFISKLQNGQPYSTGIILKKSTNQIIIDLTEVYVNSDLWLCYKDAKKSAVRLIFSGTQANENIVSSIDFNTLMNDVYTTNQVYDLLVSTLNTFNVTSLYTFILENYADDVENIKRVFALSDYSQVAELLSFLYYGHQTYDYYLGQSKTITGIYNYLISYITFNYNFNDTFDSLQSESNIIVNGVVGNIISERIRGNRETSSELSARLFLTRIFNQFLKTSIDSVREKYTIKFKQPLSLALNFGSGSVYPILNSRIEYIDNSPVYIVKLQVPLDENFVDKTLCNNVISITIQPTLQYISYYSAPKHTRIRLTPNFSIQSENFASDVSSEKTPYFSKNSIELSKDMTSLIDTVLKKEQFNVDFSDFSNFIVFSSALMRVKIFENKLKDIYALNKRSLVIESSSFYSTKNLDLQNINSSINDIVQSFDFYESYLYKTNEFDYNDSYNTFVEYNGVQFVTSSFVTDLEASAKLYDRNNLDSLTNNTPQYVRENTDYDDYLKFLCMIGHFFDNIYIYVSNFAFYNKLGQDYSDGLQKNILKYILNSFGLDVPPCSSAAFDRSTIEEFRLSSNDLDYLRNNVSLDNKTKIIWKRMLNSLPLLYKSKGTTECIRYIFSIYGVPENLINIREFGGSYFDVNTTSKNIKWEYIYPPEFIGTTGEIIDIRNISTHKSVDFKLYINTKDYLNDNRLIIPIYNRYCDVSGYGKQQFYSFGLIREHDDIGRVYFLIKNDYILTSSVLYRYVTPPIRLFTDDIYNVMIRENERTNSPLIGYDILIGNMNNIQSGESYESYSLYIPITASTLLTMSSSDWWGNSEFLLPSSSLSGSSSYSYSQSIDVALALRGTHLEIDDDAQTFRYVGNLSNTLDAKYRVDSFYGCIDGITYQSYSSSNDVFLDKCYNYNYYCDGDNSITANDIQYRFNFYPPFDISYSSSVSGGYAVENFNQNYPDVKGYMCNFTGSNYKNIWNTSSCSYMTSASFPYQTKEFYISNVYFTSEVGPDREENNKIDSVLLKNTSNTVGVSSKFSQRFGGNCYSDSNRMGLFTSPISERNDDILNFFGKEEIISTISSPASIYSNSYPTLKLLRKNFYSMPTNRILFNELFTMYKIYIDKSIFDTLKFFLPARNKVYTGILIEPTILERPKIESKPIDVNNIETKDVNLTPMRGVESDKISLLNTDTNFNFKLNKSYVYGSYSGLSEVRDIPDDSQLKIFINQSGLSELDGNYYNVFTKTEMKNMYTQNGDDVSETIGKNFDRLFLLTGSVLFTTSSLDLDLNKVYLGSDYTPIKNRSYYNNLSFKYRPSDKKSYLASSVGNSDVYFVKSRQTSKTTIIDNVTNINSPSPIISKTVSNIIKQGISL